MKGTMILRNSIIVRKVNKINEVYALDNTSIEDVLTPPLLVIWINVL